MSEILNAYKLEHGGRPKSPQELVKFSKDREDLKTIKLDEARKILGIRRRNSTLTGIGSLSRKANPKWTVGTQVLLSKDRIGIIRYVGPVPEQGKGRDVIWYGVELIDGTVGYNDGSCKGTRYFQTQDKRGMFVPPDKIRRVMNEKDKQRRDSYVQIANEIRQMKGQHSMDIMDTNGALVIHYDSNNNNNNNNNNNIYISPKMNSVESPFNAEMNDIDGNISPLSTDDQLRPWEKEEFNVGGPSHAVNMKAKLKAKTKQERAEIITKTNTNTNTKTKTKTKNERTNTRSKAYSIESDHKEYGTDLETVDTYETILDYIVRQSKESQSILLDVYADPSLHSILLDAFNQLKTMDSTKQSLLWPQLIKRWRRTLRSKN